MVLLGVESFFKKGWERYKGASIALLCNQASVSSNFTPTYFLFKEHFGRGLKFLFSPQHGLFSEKQANMIGSADEVEPFTGVPVISLYGERLVPPQDVLKEVDVIFVDLQDVGCRVYTYIWTLYLLMKECERLGKEVVVLDRPNPIGSNVEGPLLEEEFKSFVGLESLPMRHGLTIGEVALLFKRRRFSGLELKVVPLEGYKKERLWGELDREWVFPSPNLPQWQCCLTYPGLVLLEGTNLSEGRGTTLPFLLFGAPYLELKRLREAIKKEGLEEGVVLRPVAFAPTFDKWKGKRCYGFQIHLISPEKFRPVKFALRLIRLIAELFEKFEFLPPPYEFEYEKLPMEILLGNKKVLSWLKGEEEIDLEHHLYYNLKNYLEEVKEISLY